MPAAGDSITPLSSAATSSLSCSPLKDGSLLATLTSKSASPWRRPGVIGDAGAELRSLVAGDAMLASVVVGTGEGARDGVEGKMSRGESSGGGES